ncbi:MAG: hypothetical protein HN846_00870 [Candidatus Pacebacteria bacterium]|jgi:hypothetical protein|nr:hypothetical protein [Candidatus Paceibacterota bacterium]MBT3512094.1 hypothetical protein [Candidatus Paceibacterota bacterium]MBT4004419.1 hypothetical protein [Candidatus Paceibacterota bacterium]MBT4358531.1 hypothetical protein [Candidatus Paceibacterota bacterium]MBT4681328.1 hypothetical protein [Candidatus Paceibacterota bacterium]
MNEEVETTKSGLTLTDATHFGRLFVKYGGIFIVVLIVGRIFLRSAIAFWKAVNPPPPPPPTVGFGLLPAISFPYQVSEDQPQSYRLETASGTTPNYGDRAKVFLMLRSTPNLLADQKAREVAATYNFVFEPEVVGSNIYRWQKSQPLETKLEMNIFNSNFEIKSNYLSKPELLVNNELPDDFEAVRLVKDFLKNSDLLPPDIGTASGEIVYLKSLGGEVLPAVSYSDADFLQIDLNRTPIDNLHRMYGPEGYKGSVHAIISGSLNGSDSIVEMEFSYQEVDYQQMETYPIRSSQEALRELQNGQGYVTDFDSENEVIIRRVSLGYYQSDKEQDYLQPVYVFEGDNEFIGYVPAVSAKYIQTQE